MTVVVKVVQVYGAFYVAPSTRGWDLEVDAANFVEERDEAIKAVRSALTALNAYADGPATPREVAAYRHLNSFISALDGECRLGPGGNGGRHNMTWRRRKAGEGFYCDYCGKRESEL